MKQDLFEMLKSNISKVSISGICSLIADNEDLMSCTLSDFTVKECMEEIAQLEELLRLRREYDQGNDN